MYDSQGSFAEGYAVGRDTNSGNYNNCGMGFGGDWFWGIILIALLFNNGNWGNSWGNGGNFGGGFIPNAVANSYTDSAIQRGFDTQTVISKLDGINAGICSLGYDQLAQMNNLNMSVATGFHGVDNAICNLGYQTQQGFNQTNIALMQGQNALQTQLSGCCCDIRAGLKDIQFQNATDTCAIQTSIANVSRDIIDNQNANYRGLMDFMVQSKIDKLQSENQALRLSASQSAQNATLMAAMDANKAEIIRRTGNDCPIPAYVVPNPNCCYNNYGYNGFYGNNGCGCNSGCGC